MKKKKNLIITIIVIFVIVIIGLISYKILSNNNKLTAYEKKWINDNINNVHNISVVNNVNIFGSTGSGVYYEFLSDLSKEYNIEINSIAFNKEETASGLSLNVKTDLNKNDTIFYTDHYVLVSKKNEVIASNLDFSNKKIGLLNKDHTYISSFLKNINNLTLTSFDTDELLLEALDGSEIDYIIVPLTIYLDKILENNYYINYHLSDASLYYTISGASADDTLSNIVKKYYKNWSKENLNEYFKREEFNLFTNALNISETEVDAMQGVTYKYGFINNSPYEVIMSGNFGGIVAMYLHDFSEFSKVEFNYTKYRNLNLLKKAIGKKEIDLYFDYYNFNDNYNKANSTLLNEYSVITNKSNSTIINSLNSLVNKTVYVKKDSKIYSYLNDIKDINVKTYDEDKDLFKFNKKDEIIVLDKNVFDLYKSNKLSNYVEKYNGTEKDTYNFKLKKSSAFYKLFTKYIMTLDNHEVIYRGMYNYNLTAKNGKLVKTIAKYILITLVIFLSVFIILYKSSKKIKIAKKIKKENKIKFIDQLTSLKNRNYLNEYINNWNNNTIYPQAMIVIDLNNIQFINDTLGYEEGDKQIKAGANILIKTQLDNSDIMRTDGNEFLVYLVGYTQKQITNYIHKINKEFKKLPYEYGAEFGYSMINDSIKTIEDAIIEATDEMKKSKKKNEEKEKNV